MDDAVQRELKRAREMHSIGQSAYAEKILMSCADLYPGDYRVWWDLFMYYEALFNKSHNPMLGYRFDWTPDRRHTIPVPLRWSANTLYLNAYKFANDDKRSEITFHYKKWHDRLYKHFIEFHGSNLWMSKIYLDNTHFWQKGKNNADELSQCINLRKITWDDIFACMGIGKDKVYKGEVFHKQSRIKKIFFINGHTLLIQYQQINGGIDYIDDSIELLDEIKDDVSDYISELNAYSFDKKWWQ